MMDVSSATAQRTFLQVAEIWVPKDGRLVFHSGDYGRAQGFAAASEAESFGPGEGLPGMAWSEGRPVVLKAFEGSYFRRTAAAQVAGLTAGVAMPIFAGAELKAVLVILCGDAVEGIGALEVWAESSGALALVDGYYGAAKEFEDLSHRTGFARGQGLPGGVWAAATPILMRDLGAGYGFLRAESAGRAGLRKGLGLPVPSPSGASYVLTLLSSDDTPIARRFEIWDARALAGTGGGAKLIDGICDREGALWDEDNPRRTAPWVGPIEQVLATGLPIIESAAKGLVAGYAQMVALPIYRGGTLAFIVAWYL